MNLKIIVVVNKIDKKNADIKKTISKTENLFLDLALDEDHLNFPIIYAIGRNGKAWNEIPIDFNAPGDLSPLFDLIVSYIPSPKVEEGNFQMLATSLAWDSFQGKNVIGKIKRGSIKKGDPVGIITENNEVIKTRIDRIYVTEGLKKVEVENAVSGQIVSLTGISEAGIGDTIASLDQLDALPRIKIEEPTLRIALQPNTSPFSGREGSFVTSRQVLARIEKELETNIAMKMEVGSDGSYILSGRGELHLSVFLETIRREGYEVQVSKPQVITKQIDGKEFEPFEELTIDIPTIYSGSVTSEVIKRRGVLTQQYETEESKTTRLVFEIPTRGLLGIRSVLISATKGTAVVNTIFLKYEPFQGLIPQTRNGVLVATETGKASPYGLNIAQGRGNTFVGPGTDVYEGMIVGLNSRGQDIDINVCKTKHATNVRSGGLKDEGIILTPPIILSLEQAINFIEKDELVEITPKNIRLRKKILNSSLRAKANKNN